IHGKIAGYGCTYRPPADDNGSGGVFAAHGSSLCFRFSGMFMRGRQKPPLMNDASKSRPV
ncbi:MAG: hypothetical protein AB7U63_16895, partial [Porticoccaceae bacterium]